MDTLIALTYVSVLKIFVSLCLSGRKIYFETASFAEAANMNCNINDLLFCHFLSIFVSSVV